MMMLFGWPGKLAMVAAVIAGVWFYGHMQYRQGKQDLLFAIETARVEAVAEKEKIDDELDELSGDDLLLRALGFVRNPSDG